MKKIIEPMLMWFRKCYANANGWLVEDWHGEKSAVWGLFLFLLTIIPIIFYYLNYPQIDLNPDTPAYLHVVDRLRDRVYLLVDTWRLPGYPMLIVLVYALTGAGNLLAVSIVQACLFVITTLEIYSMALLLFKRSWLAFLIGVTVGTNLVQLSNVKPIMSEGLAMFELTSMALACISLLRSGQGFRWVALFLIALVFTRPEWVYLAPLLFGYLLWARRDMFRRLFKKVLAASGSLYALVALYIIINGTTNNYYGLAAIENFNWMGKLLQYNMQRLAPPEQQYLSQQLDYYVKTLDRDPYHVLPHIPELSRDNDTPAGRFARDIILRHPIEFIVKTVPLCFESLVAYYDIYHQGVHGPYDEPLNWLKEIHRWLYNLYILFPLCAALWLSALLVPRFRHRPVVIGMGLLCLLGLYGVWITTMGGYRHDDYMRVHTVFNPLLLLIIWGSILFGLEYFKKGMLASLWGKK
jgi:hypothetical protein